MIISQLSSMPQNHLYSELHTNDTTEMCDVKTKQLKLTKTWSVRCNKIQRGSFYALLHSSNWKHI